MTFTYDEIVKMATKRHQVLHFWVACSEGRYICGTLGIQPPGIPLAELANHVPPDTGAIITHWGDPPTFSEV